MDNLGDWLYIILLVVAGASGLFRSGKKKKTPTKVLGQPGMEDRMPVEEKEANVQMPGKGFWQILEEMDQQKSRTVRNQPVRPSVHAKIKKEKEKQNSSKPKYETLGSHAWDQSRFPKPIETYSSTIESSFKDYPTEEQPEVTPESFTDIEEVRKAIIYAEILNCKY
ncbi:MAG: hypothetical protein LUG96_17245 [Tannerellaceae bacterium]|nr:hypothetical protein [Tannerellaceae bacterium]